MSRYNVLRLGKFATLLILVLLWASAAPIDARIERDNGIVRVKSAVPMSEAISRIKADIAAKGIKFLRRDRPIEARGGRRHQAAAVYPARVRQSAARHAVHH